MTPASVVDASALLCYLQGEPGSNQVTEFLFHGAAISAINWAEVLAKLADRGEDPDEVARQLSEHGLVGKALWVWPVDEAAARHMARLRRITRSAGLSLADRACLALAHDLRVPALTTDHAWKNLKLGVKIQLVR